MYLIPPEIQPVHWFLAAVIVFSFVIGWCTFAWVIFKQLKYLDATGANKLPFWQMGSIQMELIGKFWISKQHAKTRKIIVLSFVVGFVSTILMVLLAVNFGVPVEEEAPYSCGQLLDCIFQE